MPWGMRAKKNASKAGGGGLGIRFPDGTASNREGDIFLNTNLVKCLGNMTILWLTGFQITTV